MTDETALRIEIEALKQERDELAFKLGVEVSGSGDLGNRLSVALSALEMALEGLRLGPEGLGGTDYAFLIASVEAAIEQAKGRGIQ